MALEAEQQVVASISAASHECSQIPPGTADQTSAIVKSVPAITSGLEAISNSTSVQYV